MSLKLGGFLECLVAVLTRLGPALLGRYHTSAPVHCLRGLDVDTGMFLQRTQPLERLATHL
ncbi:hypothetical protein DPMN_175927 [Dreissena polymorpha]|uniref:Secreted protein n=1 Tax=Dreissena polymorpha TaxID=45954 RepID=A0A9D4IHN7_DREPO|nr:hypothetical protein DPMN_175927 [Dreissena polymorpha]